MKIAQVEKKQWNLLIILLIIIMAAGYWFQSSRLNDTKINTVKNMTGFAHQIKIIDKKIVDLTWSGGLFQYEEFKKIYENSKRYSLLACEALKSPEFTEQQKIIIGHSMHGSDLDQFLSFAKCAFQLLESGSISFEVFNRVVFPSYDWSTLIVKNYDENDVSQFLQSTLESKKVNEERKKYIQEDILSGKAKLYVSKWQFMFKK